MTIRNKKTVPQELHVLKKMERDAVYTNILLVGIAPEAAGYPAAARPHANDQ